ncbi:MAG: LamG domain-containing protein [candidate division WWE3 bacterium]|nr:LamG domain-containing protein [candidate division WWE3 bacterium]
MKTFKIRVNPKIPKIFALLTLFSLFCLTSSAKADTPGNFTTSIWINPATSVASKTLIAKAEEFRIFTDASGNVGCQIKATTWQTAAQSVGRALTVGTYSQVTCSYDLATLRIYVNGALTGSTALTTAPDNTTNLLKIGQDDSAATPYGNLAGTIDEFKFYPYALSADEVKLDYNHSSALAWGAVSTNNAAPFTALNSSASSYCIPGDTASCTSPIAEYNFDEGTGTVVNDTSGNNYSGTITGATFKPGKFGTALNFNGGTDTVTITGSPSVKSVEFWVNPTTTTQNLVDLRTAATAANISVSRGTIAATGFDTPTIYVNGAASSTLIANAWQYVTITTGTAITANAIQFGRISTTSLTGKLDGIRMYAYARTPAQIAWDFNRGAPVAQYKFNECSGTIAHNSALNGNGQAAGMDGTITPNTGRTAGSCNSGVSTEMWNGGTTGKYGASLAFDGVGDYVNQPTSIAGVQTVSFWAYPTSNTSSILQLASGVSVTAATGAIAANNFTAPVYYVNGVLKTAPILTAGVWNHVVVTTATGITANAIKLALVGSTYYAGQLDDVRLYNYALTGTQVKTLYNENSAVRFGP